ncbi:Conserved_hypothetical protein [Hexamita inflata]|uniref:Uncharacterized protein n=1 Tax=Hexamita inflata TaxID=28002 RepID=A0AA86TQ08_9EUKA|nr:Conserved hypothetical protein [Hexamita inflata]
MVKEQFSPIHFAFHFTEEQIEIDDHLELGRNRLKLKEEILEQHFGSNYSEEVDNYYNNYQQRSSIETVNSQIEAPKKLEKCQLMHVFKPLPYVDLYIVIEDNSLFVVDKEFNILSQSPINCEIYSGYENKTDGIISIYEGYQHQLIPCCGKLYIQIRDKVYVLSNSQLKYVFDIQNLRGCNITSYNSCIFCLNNELYIKSLNIIYVYRNQKLVKVRQVEEWNFQHQNKVYSYEWHGATLNVFEIISENIKQPLFEIDEVEDIWLLLNGILIVKLYSGIFVIADLINANTQEFQLEMRFELDIQNNIVLGSTGVQFNNEVIEEYLGEKFEMKHKGFYEEHNLAVNAVPLLLRRNLQINSFQIDSLTVQNLIHKQIESKIRQFKIIELQSSTKQQYINCKKFQNILIFQSIHKIESPNRCIYSQKANQINDLSQIIEQRYSKQYIKQQYINNFKIQTCNNPNNITNFLREFNQYQSEVRLCECNLYIILQYYNPFIVFKHQKHHQNNDNTIRNQKSFLDQLVAFSNVVQFDTKRFKQHLYAHITCWMNFSTRNSLKTIMRTKFKVLDILVTEKRKNNNQFYSNNLLNVQSSKRKSFRYMFKI